ncbi:DUF7287 family protein [Halorubrum yunnanense]|uniref:Uncharacterized protein n=1 Tax=Halorubrum yunnanense TaxID=1526162 RepID=A0ABD5YC33_9EURY|nr:hypothetical protein [Halorubrum yunnanense]
MSGEPRTRGPALGETARAQTPIDFAIGASVFLLTLAFVVAFVPTLFDPFTAADTASPLVSDRVAAGLAGDLLAASPAEPGVLSPACTVAFFESNATLGTDADCHPAAAESPTAHFGIDGDVQVVIHALNETRPSENASTLTIPTRHGTFEDVELSRSTDGGGATGGGDVTVSRRLVSLDGTQYRLTVRVW